MCTQEIDDQWVVKTALSVEKQLYVSDTLAHRIRDQYGEDSLRRRYQKYYFCHKVVRYFAKEYPQYVSNKE